MPPPLRRARRAPPPRGTATGGGAPAPTPPARPDPIPSPPASLPVLEDPDAVEVEPEPASFGDEPLRRLLERFLGEIESPPVDRDQPLPTDVCQGPERPLARRVAGPPHDPAHVGADRPRRQL